MSRCRRYFVEKSSRSGYFTEPRSIKDALVDEEKFFRSHPIYNGLADRLWHSSGGKEVEPVLILVLRAWNWVCYLEKFLRHQGFDENSYRIFYGDSVEADAMTEQAKSMPMNFFSHDIAPRVIPFIQQTVQKYGKFKTNLINFNNVGNSRKNSFMWFGPHPRLHVIDPGQVQIALSLPNDIQKPHSNPFVKLLVDGIAGHEGAEWAKHKRIINPAFHFET